MFLLFMITFVAAGAMIAIGVLGVQLRFVVTGVLAGAIAWMARDWLCRRGRFEALVASFDAFAERANPGNIGTAFAGGLPGETQFGRLAALLHELDRLERLRGSAAFDPWAVQAVRNDIRATIAGDPALTRLFDSHRDAA